MEANGILLTTCLLRIPSDEYGRCYIPYQEQTIKDRWRGTVLISHKIKTSSAESHFSCRVTLTLSVLYSILQIIRLVISCLDLKFVIPLKRFSSR